MDIGQIISRLSASLDAYDESVAENLDDPYFMAAIDEAVLECKKELKIPIAEVDITLASGDRGFTLLVAIVTTSLLLIVSFMVVNLAFRELVISNANEESQYAFYAADSGVECALYWDLTGGSTGSRFATSSTNNISCGGTSINYSDPLPSPPGGINIIGGPASIPGSVFYLPLNNGCAIVRVTKSYTGTTLVTTIDSRGYNTCNTSSNRRVERGVILTY